MPAHFEAQMPVSVLRCQKCPKTPQMLSLAQQSGGRRQKVWLCEMII